MESQYAFDEGTVLFKPTKAAQKPFRSTKAEAISYFVGGEVSEEKLWVCLTALEEGPF